MHQMSELSNNSAIELRLALTSDQTPTVRHFGSSAEGRAVSHPTSHWMRCVAMLCCVLLNYLLLLICWFTAGLLFVCALMCCAVCCAMLRAAAMLFVRYLLHRLLCGALLFVCAAVCRYAL